MERGFVNRSIASAVLQTKLKFLTPQTDKAQQSRKKSKKF